MDIRVIAAVLMALALPVLADQTSSSVSDKELLSMLDTPAQPGMDYARCKENICYIIKTGEVIGNGKDGIYLVWADDFSPPETSSTGE